MLEDREDGAGRSFESSHQNVLSHGRNDIEQFDAFQDSEFLNDSIETLINTTKFTKNMLRTRPLNRNRLNTYINGMKKTYDAICSIPLVVHAVERGESPGNYVAIRFAY